MPPEQQAEAWMKRARCREDRFWRLFVAVYDQPARYRDVCVAVCRNCEVRPECWEYSERVRAAEGVWGGRWRSVTWTGRANSA